jgi:predicted Holliday junction resolvase-like endonuclease
VITWVVLGIVVFALLLLVLVTVPLLRRLARLRGVQAKLQRRAVEAQALVSSAEALQERAVAMQETLQTITDKAAVIQAKRS